MMHEKSPSIFFNAENAACGLIPKGVSNWSVQISNELSCPFPSTVEEKKMAEKDALSRYNYFLNGLET